jgi:ATP-dependent Clp protease ATP-binding subunit ClpB
VDFRNVILILTSNLGSQFLVDPSLDVAEKDAAVMSVVRSSFKPEFLNRLDDIVMFQALTQEQLGSIVELQIGAIQKRLSDRRIVLEVSDTARDWLARNGFDPLYGARPLRRLVQTSIGDQMARAILAGTVHDGDVVEVDVLGDALVIKPKQAVTA